MGNFLSANWIWLLAIAAMLLMHLGHRHGGHGGGRGHGGGQHRDDAQHQHHEGGATSKTGNVDLGKAPPAEQSAHRHRGGC
ncbi:hypothetical protein [Streptomyces sp. SAI-090]|jgi:hypothetical protein|uniref:hypothetical protein n=1 Tax=Streptomyces sp. SAI-090 TaxID=2940545 RepID=UPI002474CF32|nr:hypothetical protein [Streptomyces sp. SAI-090]MDH6522313.1 hypothetical protein [Streptomyces sp. SAI-090]